MVTPRSHSRTSSSRSSGIDDHWGSDMDRRIVGPLAIRCWDLLFFGDGVSCSAPSPRSWVSGRLIAFPGISHGKPAWKRVRLERERAMAGAGHRPARNDADARADHDVAQIVHVVMQARNGDVGGEG